MTVGGWVLYGFIALCVWGFISFVGYEMDDAKGAIIGLVLGIFINALILIGFLWYYGNTASGARAIKTQESNFNMGIERKVTVYDVEGDIIKVYEGKFDVTYDNDRILFDDEKGLRHIIYYPTGTVVIDEVSK